MAKITFRNGSSFEFPMRDNPEAGRALRPFEPHASQLKEFQMAVKRYWLRREMQKSRPTGNMVPFPQSDGSCIWKEEWYDNGVLTYK